MFFLLRFLPNRLTNFYELLEYRPIDLQEYMRLVEATLHYKPLIFIWVVGSTLSPHLFTLFEVTFFAVFAYIVQHISAWQAHLNYAVDHRHIRSRRCVARKKWPSDTFNGVNIPNIPTFLLSYLSQNKFALLMCDYFKL